MVIEGDELISTDRSGEKVLSLPINSFFRSLASAWGEKAIAIVLSGTGSDGSAGIMDVRAAGGLVLAQSAGQRALRRHAAQRHRHRLRGCGAGDPADMPRKRSQAWVADRQAGQLRAA
jgi:two-component system CheB/CheR fusion protein